MDLTWHKGLVFVVADTLLNLMQEELLNKSFVIVALHEGEKGEK